MNGINGVRRAALLGVLILAACDDSPTGPGASPPLVKATPEEVEVYVPALHDMDERILSTGGNASLMGRMSAALEEIRAALRERQATRAEKAVEYARDLVRECDDECLAAPERSVIELTLDHAARLIGFKGSDR